MNKLFGLALVPLGLAAALWMPCAGPQAGQQDLDRDHHTVQLKLGNTDLVRWSRADLGERLEAFQGARTPASAMGLYEALLVLEGMGSHRERALESFGPRNLPDSSREARVHYLVGGERAGLPVVPVRKGMEPDYWELDAVLQASSDPWFEFDLTELYERLVRRAGNAMGNGSEG